MLATRVDAAIRARCAGQLGQAVRPGAGVRAAVVARPGVCVGQPEVGAEVDDAYVRRQLRGDGRRLAVRQRQEDEVGVGQPFGVVASNVRSARASRCGWTSVTRRTGTAPRRHRAELELGMAENQAQQLTAGVPAGACHGDLVAHPATIS